MGSYEKLKLSWRELSPENGIELIRFELHFTMGRMRCLLMRLGVITAREVRQWI
jgi:hypothetical protein